MQCIPLTNCDASVGGAVSLDIDYQDGIPQHDTVTTCMLPIVLPTACYTMSHTLHQRQQFHLVRRNEPLWQRFAIS